MTKWWEAAADRWAGSAVARILGDESDLALQVFAAASTAGNGRYPPAKVRYACFTMGAFDEHKDLQALVKNVATHITALLDGATSTSGKNWSLYSNATRAELREYDRVTRAFFVAAQPDCSTDGKASLEIGLGLHPRARAETALYRLFRVDVDGARSSLSANGGGPFGINNVSLMQDVYSDLDVLRLQRVEFKAAAAC